MVDDNYLGRLRAVGSFGTAGNFGTAISPGNLGRNSGTAIARNLMAVQVSETNWISAGPEGGSLVSGVGLERSTDHPSENYTAGVATPPGGVTPAQFFKSILRLHSVYCNCVDYDVFPEISNSYNSDRFVFGVVYAAGGTAKMRFALLPQRPETGFSLMISPASFAGGGKPGP